MGTVAFRSVEREEHTGDNEGNPEGATHIPSLQLLWNGSKLPALNWKHMPISIIQAGAGMREVNPFASVGRGKYELSWRNESCFSECFLQKYFSHSLCSGFWQIWSLLALAKAVPPAHCCWGWSRKQGIKAEGMWRAKSISRMWSLEENFKGDAQIKGSRAECLAALLGVPVLGSQLGILTLGQIPVRCWGWVEISPENQHFVRVKGQCLLLLSVVSPENENEGKAPCFGMQIHPELLSLLLQRL